MDQLNQAIARAKAAWAALKRRFDAIQSPAAKAAAAIGAFLLLILLVRAALPWLGFIIAAGIVALIAHAFWPKGSE